MTKIEPCPALDNLPNPRPESPVALVGDPMPGDAVLLGVYADANDDHWRGYYSPTAFRFYFYRLILDPDWHRTANPPTTVLHHFARAAREASLK